MVAVMALDLTQRHEAQRRYLRTVLAWHDINQAQLGDIIGCTQTNASRKLSGKRRLTVEELLLIADHLGIDPGNLLAPPDLSDMLGPVREDAQGLVRSTFGQQPSPEAKRYTRGSETCRSCDLDFLAA